MKLPETKGLMFLNPSSGAKLPAAEVAALKSEAEGRGLEVIELSQEIDCPKLIRQKMSQGLRLFVAAGGDGTINTIVQPLINTEAVLAVIPVGTYNHFAKDLGIPLPWREALEIVVNGTVKQVDSARINERFFLNNISMGLYPELVAKREAKGRDYPRWKARIFAAWSTLKKYPHIAATLESENHHEVVKTPVLMISNNSYDLSRMGIEAPRTGLEEGRLSVYWLPHVPRLVLMSFVAHYLAGKVRTAPGFRSFRTARIKMQSPRKRMAVGVDGEVVNFETPLVITTVPKSLLVKVPRPETRPAS